MLTTIDEDEHMAWLMLMQIEAEEEAARHADPANEPPQYKPEPDESGPDDEDQ